MATHRRFSRPNRRWVVIGLLVSTVAFAENPLRAQQGEPAELASNHTTAPAPPEKLEDAAAEIPDTNEQLGRWFRYYEEQAESYKMMPAGQADRRFHLREDPVLQYTSLDYPSKSHGSLFVWTLGGRPEVIGTIWSKKRSARPGKRYVIHEMHSLSLASFEAKREEEVVWHPRSVGIVLKEIPDARRPASTPELRLVQMRELARRFSAYRVRPGDAEQLVPAEQPIYRYDVSSSELVDGAVFLFLAAENWDPELFVVIEARVRDGKARWEFAGARLSEGASRLEYRGKDLWVLPERSFGGRNDPYFYWRAETRDEIMQDDEARHAESRALGNLPDGGAPASSTVRSTAE